MMPRKDVTLQLKMTFDSLYIFSVLFMYASFFFLQDKRNNVKLGEIQVNYAEWIQRNYKKPQYLNIQSQDV